MLYDKDHKLMKSPIKHFLAKASLFAASAMLSLSLSSLAHANTPSQNDAPQKVIIDDDGFSLMHILLLNSPKINVLGLTSVTGDLWAPRAAAMQLRGLEIMGRTDVPVSQGAVYPLVNTEKATERWEALYGKLTWKGAWMKQWVEPTKQATPTYYSPYDLSNLPLGAPTTKLASKMAAIFMIDMVHKYPGEVTIIEGGPMTNLALAQRLDPDFAKYAKELIYMGGSFNPHRVLNNRSALDFAREFANSPRREFNIRLDPEAASIVSRAPWHHITIVPVDPSTATQLTPELLQRAAKLAKPALGKAIASFEPGFPLWDEMVAAIILDPSLVTSSEDLYVDYNTQFGASYGDTLSWREDYQPRVGEQKAHVILTIDPKRLDEVILHGVAAHP